MTEPERAGGGPEASASPVGEAVGDAAVRDRVRSLEEKIIALEGEHARDQGMLAEYDQEFYRMSLRLDRIEETLARMAGTMKDLAEANRPALPATERPPHY